MKEKQLVSHAVIDEVIELVQLVCDIWLLERYLP